MSATYRATQRNNNFSVSFLHSLFLLALLSSLATIIIADNLARAFGLLGTVGLVRFRTALKSPIDAVFTVWALLVGIGCGSQFYITTTLLTLTGILYLRLLARYRIGESRDIENVVRVNVTRQDQAEALSAWEAFLKRQSSRFEHVNVQWKEGEEVATHVYLVRTHKRSDPTILVKRAQTIPGVREVSFLSDRLLTYAY